MKANTIFSGAFFIDPTRGLLTPDRLRDMAAQADERYRSLNEDDNDARRQARMERDAALVCARWMESCGHKALDQVGPFISRTFRRGNRVRIKKGAVVFGTGPHISREGKILERSQVVTVHDFDGGYVDYSGTFHDRRKDDHENIRDSVRQARVHWAGAGGYWRWTDASSVELVAPAPVRMLAIQAA